MIVVRGGNIGDKVRPVRTVEPNVVIVPPQRIPQTRPQETPAPEPVRTPERVEVPA